MFTCAVNSGVYVICLPVWHISMMCIWCIRLYGIFRWRVCVTCLRVWYIPAVCIWYVSCVVCSGGMYIIMCMYTFTYLVHSGDVYAIYLFVLYIQVMFLSVRSRNCGCLVTRFCYQLIAKPGNKTAAVSWPDPYDMFICEVYSGVKYLICWSVWCIPVVCMWYVYLCSLFWWCVFHLLICVRYPDGVYVHR